MNRDTIVRMREGVALLSGAICGLLTARLVLKILAARPDSPAVIWLYNLSNPLVAPLSILDREQPRFGAILELSTLATLLILISLTSLSWVWLGRIAQR